MKYEPFSKLVGGFSSTDGTLEYYLRVNALLRRDFAVLDLGAGRAGWFEDDPVDLRRDVRLMTGKVREVIAADVDPAVLENRASDRQVLIEDGRLPLPDGSVDLITADYVLEHVEDPAAFRAEADRVLKPGGWFCARTPHKYSYISIVSRLVENADHSRLLRAIQPERKEEDVFPAFYRLNTLREVERRFAGWESRSYVFKADPAYYFGSRPVFWAQKLAHGVMHPQFSGVLLLFLRKPC